MTKKHNIFASKEKCMNIHKCYRPYLLLVLFIFACQNAPDAQTQKTEISVEKEPIKTIVTGAENTFAYFSLLKDKNIAIVANHTSLIKGTHLVDSLSSAGFAISSVFAPEHGFRGKADAGEKVNDEIDQKTGIPILSLYGKNKKPSPESLKNIDIVLFDIQDVGVRFYTYISTLHYIMEACAESNIPLIVLDRPNPHAHYIDGPILEEEYKSFVGMHKVPVVYGLTIAEYATMINGERWLENEIQCNLTIVPCMNYNRKEHYQIPIKPSPNLPNSLSIQLYPSLCFFEGTSVSAGRGTDIPFQCYGHPKMTSDYSFTPKSNEGAKYPKFKDEKVKGVDLSSNDLRKVYALNKLDLSHLLNAYANIENAQADFFLDNNFFEKLAGTKQLRKQILAGKTESEIRDSWQSGLSQYELTRTKYLMY